MRLNIKILYDIPSINSVLVQARLVRKRVFVTRRKTIWICFSAEQQKTDFRQNFQNFQPFFTNRRFAQSRMHFQQQLANFNFFGLIEFFKNFRQNFEFAVFDVDLQNVDPFVAQKSHNIEKIVFLSCLQNCNIYNFLTMQNKNCNGLKNLSPTRSGVKMPYTYLSCKVSKFQT